MDYGKNIASLRANRHMTQFDLAEEIGVKRSILSHYENGRREPDYKTLLRIADFFGVSLDALFGRKLRFELSEPPLLEQSFFALDGAALSRIEWRGVIAFVRALREQEKA